MIKKIITYLSIGLCANASVWGSMGGTDITPEAQYEAFYALTQTRGPGDAFPELLARIDQNAAKIRAVLPERLHADFDHSNAKTRPILAGENALTLFRFNMAHYIWSHFLTAGQRGQELDQGALTTRLACLTNPKEVQRIYNHLKDIADFTVIPDDIREILHLKLMVDVVDKGLYPYTLLCDTGIFALETLNKSFAMRTPLCGLPLQKSAYDGRLDADSQAFLEHDWEHSTFNKGPDWPGLNGAYEAYHTLFNLIMKNQDPVVRGQDHLVTFFMMHESFNTLERAIYTIANGKVIYLQKDGTPLTCQQFPAFHWGDSCDQTKKRLKQSVEYSIRPFGENEIHTVLSIELSPIQQAATVVDIIESYGFSKEKPLLWGHVSDWADKPKLGWIKGASSPEEDESAYLGELGFEEYNQLFDVRAMLSEVGFAFPIWKDGKFNASEMITVLSSIVDGFQSRYGAHFPQAS